MASVASSFGNQQIGEAQRLFSEQSEARVQELMDTGQVLPCTIVNFNPVPLTLQGLFKQYKVPSPQDERLPSDVMRLTLPYDGLDRVGHMLTIRSPKKDGKMIGATSGGAPGEVIPQREPKIYLPKDIGFSFMEHYSPVFTTKPGTVQPPPPNSAKHIFGVLVFEGDIHTLENLLNEDDPAKRVIRVPTCNWRTTGKTSIKTIHMIEYNFDKYLDQMFQGQRKWGLSRVMRAQQRWNGTDEDRANISNADRVWYRFCIDHGYCEAPKQGEKTWLDDAIFISIQASRPVLRKCQACRTPEPEPDTPFCSKCNAPIDTFKTFMDGFPVADSWLMALKGEQRELALQEMHIRRAGFGETGPLIPIAPAVMVVPEAPKAISVLGAETLLKLTVPEVTAYALTFGLLESELQGKTKAEIIAKIEEAAKTLGADGIPAAASFGPDED